MSKAGTTNRPQVSGKSAEEKRAYQQAYRKANREKVLAGQQAWRNAHREERAAKARAYRATPEGRAATRAAHQRWESKNAKKQWQIVTKKREVFYAISRSPSGAIDYLCRNFGINRQEIMECEFYGDYE